MAFRCYFVPKVGTGTEEDPFRAAYVDGLWMPGFCEYGKEPWAFVVVDVSPAQHSAIIANADAIAVPQDIDDQIGANLGTVQTKLEVMNIPSGWVNAGMTYRFVVRMILYLFVLMQDFKRLDVLAARFFASGLTLNNTVADIPVAVRQRLIAAAQSRGLDTSSITLATTIRVALFTLIQQYRFPLQLGAIPL